MALFGASFLYTFCERVSDSVSLL